MKETVFNHRLNIFIGAYGSGKSEVSVNVAKLLKDETPDSKVLIADLDIVNPFYRSSDAEEALDKLDIRLIKPMYVGTNVEAPVLTGEVYSIFDDESYKGVFDIGGEDSGAVILGSLKNRLDEIDYGVYMVINTLRPFTETPEQIISVVNELQNASELKIDAFINNTNLLEGTTAEMLLEGEKTIMKASEMTGIPVAASSIMSNVDFTEETLNGHPVFKLERYIKYEY